MLNRYLIVSLFINKRKWVLGDLACKSLDLTLRPELSLDQIIRYYISENWASYTYLGIDLESEPKALFKDVALSWYKNNRIFSLNTTADLLENPLEKNKTYIIIIHDTKAIIRHYSVHLFGTYEKSKPYLNCELNVLIKD